MKHKHAENIIAYGQDAMETHKPWERWEYRECNSAIWRALSYQPSWSNNTEYRRKPRTININGFEVPEPVREPLQIGQEYYMPRLESIARLSLRTEWRGDEFDLKRLKMGIIHLPSEAAELHAKALLSFTENP